MRVITAFPSCHIVRSSHFINVHTPNCYNIHAPTFVGPACMLVATRVVCMMRQRIYQDEIRYIPISCIELRETVIVLMEFELAEYHV